MRKWNVLEGSSIRASKTCLSSQPKGTLLLKRRPNEDTPAKHTLYNYTESYEMAFLLSWNKMVFLYDSS